MLNAGNLGAAAGWVLRVHIDRACWITIREALKQSAVSCELADNHASESELLGTLAHETVHAVQDCIEGRIGDGLLSNVASALRRHGGPKEMQIANEFDSIRNAYLAGSGIDRHIFNNYLSYDKELESEAWAIETVPSHVSAFIDACRSLQVSGVMLNSK